MFSHAIDARNGNFLGLLVLLLLSCLASSTWYYSECKTPAVIECRLYDEVKCLISDSRNNSLNQSLPRYVTETMSISIRCERICHRINLTGIIEEFPFLMSLHLISCKYDDLQGQTNNSPSNWNITFDWTQQRGGDYGFIMKHMLEFNVPELSRPCLLRKFVSYGNISRFYPIFFIRKCTLLDSITLEDADFSTLDSIDFGALFLANRMMGVNLSGNWFRNFFWSFEQDVMDKIRQYAKDQLNEWISQNKKFLNSSRLDDLAATFRGWKNDTEQLTLVKLIKIFNNTHKNPFIYLSYDRTTLLTLKLDDGRIQSIPKSIVGFTSLQILSLKNNHISNICDDDNAYVLYALSHSLTDLDLSNNRITKIYESALLHMAALRNLIIFHNHINALDQDRGRSNNSLKSLTMLDLRHNNINGDSIYAFSIPSVTMVDLSHNNIFNVVKNFTECFPGLVTLNMSNNQINHIKPGIFRNLVFLKFLDLTNNPIRILTVLAMRTSVRRSLGLRVNVALSNETIYVCDCNSVFNGVINDKPGHYQYPHLIYDPRTKCTEYGKGKHKDVVAINTKRIFECHRSGNNVTTFTMFGKKKKNSIDRGMCPSECRCTYTNDEYWVSMNCANASLKNLPHLDKLQPNVVDLSDNSLERLTNKSFGENISKCAKKLYLVKCGLSRIEAGTFQLLKILKYLYLTSNNLTFLDASLFHGLDHLEDLNLEGNLITSFNAETFSKISKLYFLTVANNGIICDCSWEVKFLSWAERSNENMMNIILQEKCNLSREVQKSVNAAPTVQFVKKELQYICHQYEHNLTSLSNRNRIILVVALTVGTILLLVLAVAISFLRFRYSITKFMDSHLRSQNSRAFWCKYTGLQNYHGKRYDLGFLFHIKQTAWYYKIRLYIDSTDRRNLRMKSFSANLPGCLNFRTNLEMAGDLHTCVVLLTDDFLRSDEMVDTFLCLMTKSLEAGSKLNIIYVYGDNELPFDFLRVHLRHHIGLHWQSKFFWERFIASLPPQSSLSQPQSRYSYSVNRDGYIKLADLCIVCDSAQVCNQVTHIFNRYRNNLDILCVYDDKCFGKNLERLKKLEMLSLNTLLGCSTQAMVILSMDFLESHWVKDIVTNCLAARLSNIEFEGSIVCLANPSEYRCIKGMERYRYFNQVLDHRYTTSILWNSGSRTSTWKSVDEAIVSLNKPFYLSSNAEAMDSEEVDRLLYTEYVKLGPVDPDHNVFQQNYLGSLRGNR